MNTIGDESAEMQYLNGVLQRRKYFMQNTQLNTILSLERPNRHCIKDFFMEVVAK